MGMRRDLVAAPYLEPGYQAPHCPLVYAGVLNNFLHDRIPWNECSFHPLKSELLFPRVFKNQDYCNAITVQALNELMPALEAANISLQATVTLSHEDYTEHLQTLKEKDCRIFIASFSTDLARKVFCQAYHLGMYGADYAWVLSGAPQDSWWQVTQGTNCSRQQLVEATQGTFLVANHGSIIGENASESGLTNSQFLREFSHTGQPLTEYVTQTYDAVWTIALALRQGTGRRRRYLTWKTGVETETGTWTLKPGPSPPLQVLQSFGKLFVWSEVSEKMVRSPGWPEAIVSGWFHLGSRILRYESESQHVKLMTTAQLRNELIL
ncbi:uncharacterized protein [Palaemon carinicauda]|uniref:uncharacterized protein n=1 Tax=Palaemon carinicauda TaxID=392227 RepID=UPI0035B5AD2C